MTRDNRLTRRSMWRVRKIRIAAAAAAAAAGVVVTRQDRSQREAVGAAELTVEIGEVDDLRDGARRAAVRAEAGRRAAEVVERHGVCLLTGVLRTDLFKQVKEKKEKGLVEGAAAELARRIELDPGAVVGAVGALAATMLPTVHQADAWRNVALGARLGQFAATAAFTAAPDPTLIGCAQAVRQLRAHAASPYRPSLLGSPQRALELHPPHDAADAADAARFAEGATDDELEHAAELHPSTHDPLLAATPQASLLRSWARQRPLGRPLAARRLG